MTPFADEEIPGRELHDDPFPPIIRVALANLAIMAAMLALATWWPRF